MRLLSLLFFMAVLLAACGDDEAASAANAPMPPDQRRYDSAQLKRGEQLFHTHCATCHGQRAVGDPNWRQRGADGLFPPPPLDGSAHAWHHPLAQLRHTVKNGGPAGNSGMPAWRDTLDDQQIDDILLWLQSLWPDPVYAAWYDIEQRARAYAGQR